MKTSQIIFLIAIGILGILAYRFATASNSRTNSLPPAEVQKSDEEWQSILGKEQYDVTRQHGTERAFSGKYWDNKEVGTYNCVCCEAPLFESETKFRSGTGWPSFWQPIEKTAIGTSEDRALFSVRTEVHCRRCRAHLGHVFPDGPEPTGLRYCINSASLNFDKFEKPTETE